MGFTTGEGSTTALLSLVPQFSYQSPRTVLKQRDLRGKQEAGHAKACCAPPMPSTPFATRPGWAATPSSPRPRPVPGRGACGRLQGPPPLQECAAFVWGRAWPVHRVAERLLPPGPRARHPRLPSRRPPAGPAPGTHRFAPAPRAQVSAPPGARPRPGPAPPGPAGRPGGFRASNHMIP